MTTKRLAGFSAAFDELLERNRQALERLSAHRTGLPRLLPGSDSPPVALDPDSDAAQTLRRAYGDAWRFRVANWRREDDTVIVVGRLSLQERNLHVMQSAGAPILRSGAAGLSGTVDGIAFKVAGDAAAAASNEASALRRAVEQAAANCLRWLAETQAP